MKGGKFTLLLTIVFTLLIGCSLFAQEREEYGWSRSVVGNLNLTQTQFDNWVQGGENTISWQLSINGALEQKQENYRWENSGKISYGQSKMGDNEYRKSVDELSLESIFIYLLNWYVDPYVALNGETQMASGYVYSDGSKIEVSRFLDPVYFTESMGLGCTPIEEFKTRLGFAVKQTYTSDYPIPYADDPETEEIEKTKIELGAESVTNLKVEFHKNILLTSKLELFSNMEAFDEIDVKWDNLFIAKISEYINVNLNVKLLYDKDISKKRQIEQALALGITYNLL